MNDEKDYLCCPVCKSSLDEIEGAMTCRSCNVDYRYKDGVPCFISRNMYGSDQEFENALKIIEFWGRGWERRLNEDEHAPLRSQDPAKLRDLAVSCIDGHRTNQSFMADIVDRHEAKNSTFLNIGSGAGSEALVIAHAGAKCIAMDITNEAARSAQSLLQRAQLEGFGIQADARFIPIRSSAIDAVYSSGVLHHSPQIDQSIREIHRVLKPDGRIYIMLYATWSILFLQPRIFGLFRGHFSRRKQERFMSANTENAWQTETRKNPLTMTFSAREARQIFSAFRNVKVSKRVFSFRQIKFIGRFLALLGMVDVLDRTLKFMNPVFGACLFIEAQK
jgi:ubiquinone/menaquinone biosynthesis C-methylase UbiE/uncharacterized protein YbaR (Trm112 family)